MRRNGVIAVKGRRGMSKKVETGGRRNDSNEKQNGRKAFSKKTLLQFCYVHMHDLYLCIAV